MGELKEMFAKTMEKRVEPVLITLLPPTPELTPHSPTKARIKSSFLDFHLRLLLSLLIIPLFQDAAPRLDSRQSPFNLDTRLKHLSFSNSGRFEFRSLSYSS